MFIDCHTHTNFNAYKDDSKEVIVRALRNNVWMIQVGSQRDTSERAVKIAEEYSEGVYATVALHPIHLIDTEYDAGETTFHTRAEFFDREFYKKLALSSKKVVAIGECGLDYFHLSGSSEEVKKNQKETFRAHVELAQELQKPVMIHTRASENDLIGAYQDVFEILDEFPDVVGMMHCYLCPIKEIAKKLLERGVFFSFSGVITFKNAREMQDIVRYISSDRILSETDAPYLTPEPFRGKRNEPLYVKYVTKKISELKGIPEEEMEEQIFQNAKMVFGI